MEMAKRMPEVQFIVAGNCIEKIVAPKNVLLLGQVTDQIVLACHYSMADVTLLTSKKETYSMVTAESLCCGTPVVGFRAGGPEQIAITEYSVFVEYGNLDALERAVRKVMQMKTNKEIVSKEAVVKFGKNTMCNTYIEAYKELYSK